MPTTNDNPRTDDKPKLDGCAILPPLEPSCPKPEASASKRTADGKQSGRKDSASKQTAGRFATLNAFIDETLATLCRGDIAVWLVLYRDTRNGTARTSQADIARRSGVSDRSVRKSLRRLEHQGLLKLVYRGGLCRGASRYRVEPLATALKRQPKTQD